MAEQLDASISRHDARADDLQAQVDDLRQALRDWRRTREYSQPTEERLAQITLQCARMVESWQQAERRRNTTLAAGDDGRAEWNGAETGIQQATGDRIRALERAIEREWNSLPEGGDAAPGQLGAQVVSLAESCVTAANLTLRGFANAESRLATLEQGLETHMTQLSRDLQAVLAELRSARPPALAAAAAPAFPLESVMRIHEELREPDATPGPAPEALKSAPVPALPPPAEPDSALVQRVASLERTVESVAEAAERPRGGWRPLYSVAAIAVAVAGLAFFGLWMQRRVDARLNEAALRVSAAERERDETTAATRAEAARQVDEARESAAKAQIVANVLAAPDLVRYWLTGGGPDSRAYAQVLFSRSRGMVFSASRLEQPGAGRAYQLWLLTRGAPINAGMIVPDSAGRVTLATDVPLTVPGRLMGAVVTVEAPGGGTTPSTERVLIRAE